MSIIMDNQQGILRVLWSDVREHLKQIEPLFTSIVDELEPDDAYPLYILNFPYGEMIGDDHSQFIPHESGKGFHRLTSPNLPEQIAKDLGYGKDSAPLGMVLNKAIEFYVDLPNKTLTLPIRIAYPGEFYNFSRILSIPSNKKPFAPNGLLKATAGARTTFSLPYLTCSTSFTRLERDIGTLSKYPASQYDHFQLFKEICNNEIQPSKWRMQLIYFSKSWIDSILNDEKWFKLRSYLYQLAWKASDYKRNQFYYDISYSIIQEEGNCRTNPYLNDTARHLLDMAIGAFPGLAPQTDDKLLPLKTIQHTLSYSYGLKKHIPTIIAPAYFDYTYTKPVYYSLQYPITRAFSPKTKNSISMLNHLHDLKKIMGRFIAGIIKEDSMWYDTILIDAVKNIQFTYIHNNQNKLFTPTEPMDIVNLDKGFLHVEPHCIKHNDEAATEANFFRGCISLSRK